MQILEDTRNYCMGKEGLIYRALELIELNRAKAVLVLDGGVVYGVVTDGDIRKALLNKRTLETPIKLIMNEAFKFCVTVDEAEEMFTEVPYISVIPLVVSAEDRTLVKLAIRF